jgi:hypothetical protein
MPTDASSASFLLWEEHRLIFIKKKIELSTDASSSANFISLHKTYEIQYTHVTQKAGSHIFYTALGLIKFASPNITTSLPWRG